MTITSNRVFLTLKYMLRIEGDSTVPVKSFPYRMGCHNSDMFRIVIDNNTDNEYFSDGISLSEYHAAFLCSPIFQMELWLLKQLGIISTNNIDPITTTIQHLQGVATGDHSSFGPWTTWAVEGNRSRSIGSVSNILSTSSSIGSKETSSSSTATPCVIMRCRTRHGPFCDTWWALELEEETTSNHQQQQRRRPQLVFGTSLLNGYQNSILVRLMTPLHRLYSRLLLANCKATLVYKYQKHQR